MSITNFKINFPGQTACVPRFGHLYSSDTLATIAGSGYLNPYMTSQGFSVLATDIIFAVGSDGTQIYKPVFSGATVQLTVLP